MSIKSKTCSSALPLRKRSRNSLRTEWLKPASGLFIRYLVGLNREAAKQSFAQFLSGSTASANQIEFINLIIDHRTHYGMMDAGLLYQSPFIDINSQEPEAVFSPEQLDNLISVLDDIRTAAAA